MNNFPKDFLWGASTSAYQFEGGATADGKGLSQQDVINAATAKVRGVADASVASDHYHKYKEDVQLLKELGLKSYRFSISWARIFPKGRGKVNEKGLQFYRNLIDELVANGITPIITLYHYDLPMALVDEYDGWLNRRVVDDFESYARFVITEFKDKVKHWLTINEQSIIVQFWTKKCFIKPEYEGNDQLRFQINHHMNLAHAKACKLVHDIVDGGMVGSAMGYAPIYPNSSKPEDALAALSAHDIRNSFYLDIYFKGIYNKAAMIYLESQGLAPIIEDGDMAIIAAGPSDFLAINYYISETAMAYGGDYINWMGVNLTGKKGDINGFEKHPGEFQMTKNTNLQATDWDWSIDPMGLEYTLRDIYNRYNKPLMITENGMGAHDVLLEDGSVNDDYRVDYLSKHIQAVSNAMDHGVEMIAYNLWSAIDILSTSNGFKKRYGLVYVDRTDGDVKECKRYPKKSYYWYQNVIMSNGNEL